MIIVADSLARAFAIAGAAGLVRYRASIEDPKEADVLLVSLAVGLASGAGLYAVALTLCVFVIVVMWILESLEPPDRRQFDLVIESKDSRSEEHTSELQSHSDLVCRLLLEKKKNSQSSQRPETTLWCTA